MLILNMFIYKSFYEKKIFKIWKNNNGQFGYFCMGQRMMWNNVVNLSISLVNKFNFENYISRWKNISLHTKYALNILKVQILLVMNQLKRLVIRK